MKKIALIAAMGLMGLGSAIAQTQTTGPLNVSVTLAARCQLAAVGSTNMTFTSYTAFGAAVDSNAVDYTLSCTRNFGTPVVTFDVLGVGGALGAADGSGVVGGLRYTIATTIGTVTAGAAATAAPSSIGGADTRNIGLVGTIAAGQAGDSSAATSQTRVVTVTY